MSDLGKSRNNASTGQALGEVLVKSQNLIAFHAYNQTATKAWLMLFDSSVSVATGTSTPIRVYPVASFTGVDVFWPAGLPRVMDAGIYLAGSTNGTSYVSIAATFTFDVQTG